MVTDDTRRAFIAEMRTMPDDDLRRLVYADMLEEDGDDLDRSHAWLIRHMIAQRDHHIVVDNRPGMKAVHCSGRLQFKNCGAFMRRLGRRFGSPLFALWRRGFPTVVHGSWGWWGTHREEFLLHSVKPAVSITDFPDSYHMTLVRPLTGVKARRFGDAGWAVDGVSGALTAEQALARLYPEVGQFHLPASMEARRFAEAVGYDFNRRVFESMFGTPSELSESELARRRRDVLEAPMTIPPGMFTRLAALPVIEGDPVNLQLRRVASPVRVTREMLDEPTIDATRLHAEMVQHAAFRRIAESLAVPPWIADPDRAGTENPEGPK